MGFSRFSMGVAWRSAVLFLTIAAVAWMVVRTQWYVAIALLSAAALAEMALLVRFSSRSSREVARFLDALAVDDLSQSFTNFRSDGAFRELGAAMERVLSSLRVSRSERDEQAHYLQALVNHVPVALISVDPRGEMRSLNTAARRLFEGPIKESGQLYRYGQPFAVGLESLLPGSSAIVRMERSSGGQLLKVAATEIVVGGLRRRLISLQNIESEMSAHELAAWQNVIRVMAHEVMNSLTPVCSLSATARDMVAEVLAQMSPDDSRAKPLADALEALETAVRRSEGLLHFVSGHRRLTRPLEAQMRVMPVQRLFARIHRLLATDLAERGIRMASTVEPETLELAIDADLLDQALINLVRNAIEALRDAPQGRIDLCARRAEGRIAISVADNGPGISPDQREKVFVPFFTTKRRGSGIGLTLVRQIAAAHGATVDVLQTPGGGATVRLLF
jgi:nitrogen fixation/metabolism regulation signal transduction histidine kinase